MMPMTNIIYNHNSILDFSDDIISHKFNAEFKFSISLLFRKTSRVETLVMTRGRNEPIKSLRLICCCSGVHYI